MGAQADRIFTVLAERGYPDPWAAFGDHLSWESAHSIQLKTAIDTYRKEPAETAHEKIEQLFALKAANLTAAADLLAKALAEYDITRIKALREQAGMSQNDLAVKLCVITGTTTLTRHDISRRESGKRKPTAWLEALAIALGTSVDDLSHHAAAEVAVLPMSREDDWEQMGEPLGDDEFEALELVRRVSASDVGDETLTMIEMAFDDLAIGYSRTPPADLLGRTRRHLTYVLRLLDGKKTLAQHHRLLVTGGWLSLLAATCHVDLGQRPAATARLRTAAKLAEQAGQTEITAWCMETEAWQALTDGDYQRAVVLAQAGQAMAAKGGSAYIQSSAQEGRAWARIGGERQTNVLLDRVTSLGSNLAVPEQTEHHYRYDPAKPETYAATTLAWLGDPRTAVSGLCCVTGAAPTTGCRSGRASSGLPGGRAASPVCCRLRPC